MHHLYSDLKDLMHDIQQSTQMNMALHWHPGYKSKKVLAHLIYRDSTCIQSSLTSILSWWPKSISSSSVSVSSVMLSCKIQLTLSWGWWVTSCLKPADCSQKSAVIDTKLLHDAVHRAVCLDTVVLWIPVLPGNVWFCCADVHAHLLQDSCLPGLWQILSAASFDTYHASRLAAKLPCKW